MRILTVKQPWAAAIIHSGKDVENRPRNIAGAYRGPVAIHAGKSFDDQAFFPDKTPLPVEVFGTVGGLVQGAIIGVVDLVAVHHAAACLNPVDVADDSTWTWCSPWAQNDVQHLTLANPRALTEPIPYTGALGLRHLDADTTARILAQIGDPQ